jgi:methylmalonyl-CoA mutase cobalamin-binding domain/chain
MPICRTVKRLLDEQDLADKLWLVGGNIPTPDHEALKALGVDAIFSVGSPPDGIVQFIRARLS